MEVEDTGAGIAPEDVPHLFEPFFQTSTGKRAGGGTGLGLPISREFVHLMGGDLTVSSQLSKGSTFRFDVRVDHGTQTADLADATPGPRVLHLLPGVTCRVLVADDEQENRDLIQQLLVPIGFEIRTAQDGAEALAECQVWPPHVVLLDLRMPVLDGYEAARRIRAAHGPVVKIIAVSASVFAEDQRRALGEGADAFLTKPFREAELLARIKQVTGVDYVYDDLPVAAAAPADTAAESLSAEDLRQLPVALVDQLREAACRAHYGQLLALVEQVAARNGTLGDRFRMLVKRFDYEALQTILASKEA